MLLPTTAHHDHSNCGHHHHHHEVSHKVKTHDEVNTYGHLIKHLTTDKDARKLTILLFINLICAFLEVVYGFLSNSIGLLSDSAHMLFDSTALAVGIYASYKATLPANTKFSYGFDRFQTLSGLINGIFLIFIGFYIFIESLERMYNPPVIQSHKMIVVAIIGLIVNVVGVTFFHEHAHFHDDHSSCSHGHSHASKQVKQEKHSHSHKAHSHDHKHSYSHDHSEEMGSLIPVKEEHHHGKNSHSHKKEAQSHHHEHGANCNHSHDDHEHGHNHKHESHGHVHSSNCDHSHNDQQPDHHHQGCSHDHEHNHAHSHEEHHEHEDHEHQHHNENLYGVFLHILADLLGSVGVITSSILIMLFEWHVADAVCSAITSLLILASVVPLIKSSIMVFLQTYPARYKQPFHQALQEISQHPAIIECREPHLWAYTQSKLVCSVILVVKNNTTDTNSVVEFARKKLSVIKRIEYMTIDCRLESEV